MSVMSTVDLRIETMKYPQPSQIREACKYLQEQGYDIPAMCENGNKFVVAYAEEVKRIKAAV